jgi:hypothetical protein
VFENTSRKACDNVCPPECVIFIRHIYPLVDFPTRIYKNSITTIDNKFINTTNHKSISVYPWINGLSDHDAQIIVLHDITIKTCEKKLYFCRNFNRTAVTDLNLKLSYECWDDIFSHNDVNVSFNKFLNTYLTIFYCSFPTKTVHDSLFSKAWLTQGIKISCINKRKLCLNSRHSQDQNKKLHYRRYSKILAEVIKLAKRKYYNKLLINSTNKTKTTWNIIENINNRRGRQDTSSIKINGDITQNNQVIADTFNNYYSSVAQHVTNNFSNSNSVGNKHNPVNYLSNILKQPLLLDKLKFVSPKEIENVSKSLKSKECLIKLGYDAINMLLP